MSESQSNPYAAPPTEADASKPKSNDRADFDFGDILRRWERLRIVYNAVLIVWTLFLLALLMGRTPIALFVAVPFGGLLANLLYLLGPAIEAYATWFGFWHRSMTYILFLAGLGFTALLALGVLIS